MKNIMIWGIYALIGLCLCTLASCKDDDDNRKNDNAISIKLNEVGEENSEEGMAGKDLHIEGEVIAQAKIKGIRVELADAKNAVKVSEDYSQEAKYVNVINITFHEHLELPGTLEAGDYTLRFTVTDQTGNSKTESVKVKITKKDANAPLITDINIGDGSNKGKAGAKVKITANVTTKSAVEEIEIEFHGKKEFPTEFEKYKGRTGSFKFEEELTLPSDKGEYHVHFTVKDKDGRKNTEEVEGFVID